MKSKEIMLLVIVGAVSAVIAIFISNSLISGDKNRNETVEVVPLISAEFNRPPSEYFNENSINPTLTIQIDEQGNQQPFGTTE